MNIIIVTLIIYLVIINIVSVIVTIADKYFAVKHKWRVKESTLLILSALGGAVGMYLTMHTIRHKTRHLKFMLGIPVIFALQCVLLFVLWRCIYG